MDDQPWKYIFSSVIGASHSATNTSCQDSCICEVIEGSSGSRVLVVVASDGAGSAKHAEAGSDLTSSFLVEQLKVHLANGARVRDLKRDLVETWILKLRDEIALRAEAEEGLSVRDFAATLLAAVIDEDSAAFFQIGDGAIVIPGDEDETYVWIFWPQQGQYANETNFVTDQNAPQKLEFVLVSHRVDEVAVFTDGVQSLALHYQSRQAHNPFFLSVFRWLRSAPHDRLNEFQDSLISFLNSEKINERTDDDKTLSLATRLPVTSSDPRNSNNATEDRLPHL